MPLSADELAERLLRRPVTETRVLKLRRHLRSSEQTDEVLQAIQDHRSGGEDVRAFVHQTLTSARPQVIPPLPPDIQAKVDAFKAQRARDAASRNR